MMFYTVIYAVTVTVVLFLRFLVDAFRYAREVHRRAKEEAAGYHHEKPLVIYCTHAQRIPWEPRWGAVGDETDYESCCLCCGALCRSRPNR